MAKFIVRVELHSANSADYDKLHKEMQSNGFTDEIVSNDNRVFKMPPGEYTGHKNLTTDEVRDLVNNIAGRIVNGRAVLVSESIGSSWIGLEQIR
ncbi:hypothetical protein [Hydrogenovibrio sp. JE_KL2]|uniref:hypothetical protein n=1 Tax=Hydrogenovibrio sp. JE_KL2 TaxID=2651188 RepID=UPI00128BD0A1|nr:hypothetical protein [Hydrogenovibrio sp. JE_KL2]MPQ77512.1 hypothetical protein [Hydrogenovibrio sp. JE_KL2]